MKRFFVYLIQNPLFPEGPSMSISLDARDFDHAEELASRLAESVDYIVEQVSEVSSHE